MQSTQNAVAQAAEVQRVRLGRKKTAVAAEMGISLPSLSKRLSGAIPLDLNDIDSLARALDMDPFDLLAAARSEVATAA